ncbi:hypothetical protein [Faecalibacterium sp.]|uniref:hypothetical protein n=1 Tax=Faecalibacterium sp. TaxID=1971605 RepID=UPI00399BCB28
MFSEGRRKFIGLEKNSHVCLAIYDKYDGFGNLKSLQVTGIATMVEPFSEEYNTHAAFKKIPLDALKKTALTDESNLRDAYPHRCSVLRFQERRLQRPAGRASACVNRISQINQ